MQELARAKVNLCLHITGRRDDGYHLLESIVVFPQIGDLLVQEGEGFHISGPFAEGLSRTDNLVLRAAKMLGVKTGLHLVKNLPVASGIGGGSADAAAALRLLANGTPPDGAALGADVPACLISQPLRMRGIGDKLDLLPPLPDYAMVLANAGVPVSTPEVFAALKNSQNPPCASLPAGLSQRVFFEFIASQRNDLQAPALALCPEIAAVLAALKAQPTCALARMSGSGGTCFGLFQTVAEAEAAAEEISRHNPLWWVVAAAA